MVELRQEKIWVQIMSPWFTSENMENTMNKAMFFLVQSLLVTALVLGYSLASLAPAALANAPLTDSDFTDSDFTAITTYIEAEMKAQHIPGLALAIVQGDRIVHLQGFGVANPRGEPVTRETPFILGSVSKSFTAMAVMQLVDAGQIELDAPVQRYLPWFRVADEQASSAITVRHLLNQTSGIAEAAGLNNATSRDMSDGALEAQVRGFSTARLNHAVGEVFEYSNANYDILGLIVQTVSGQAYGSYIQEHIFVPLEMTHAFTSETEAMAQGLATGHRFWFGRPLPFGAPYTLANQPSGFLIAGAQDMAHYLIAYLNNGTYAGKSVLSPSGIAAMHQRPLQDEGESYYGMGWFVGEVDGIPKMTHGGDTANFHTTMTILPEGK
jgi:CubicO group peptidase (beta-lactamase class C family)